MTLVWKTPFPTQAQKLIALKLADYASDAGGSVFPSRDTLAVQAGCSEATAKRTLRVFRDIGLLHLVREGGNGAGSTNEWRINVPLLEALAAGRAVMEGGVSEIDIAWCDDEPAGVDMSVDNDGTEAADEGGQDDPLGEGRGSFGPIRGSSSTDKGVTGDPQPTKNHHLDSSSHARAGACEAGGSPARAGKPAPSISVRRGDPSWADWLASIDADRAAKAEAAGEIVVTARWPTPEARFIGVVAP